MNILKIVHTSTPSFIVCICAIALTYIVNLHFYYFTIPGMTIVVSSFSLHLTVN